MTKVLRLLDRVTGRVIGKVDAGACVAEMFCCCKGTSKPHWRLTCTGGCVYNANATCNPSVSCYQPV
jgi:hypothetical protein